MYIRDSDTQNPNFFNKKKRHASVLGVRVGGGLCVKRGTQSETVSGLDSTSYAPLRTNRTASEDPSDSVLERGLSLPGAEETLDTPLGGCVLLPTLTTGLELATEPLVIILAVGLVGGDVLIIVELNVDLEAVGETKAVVSKPSDDFSISGVTVLTGDPGSVSVTFLITVEFSDVTSPK